MALSPHDNEAFLREVDEGVRRDRLTDFWTRWGKLAAVALVLAIAAFGGFLYWQHRQTEAAGEQGVQLSQVFEALGSGNVAGAQPKLATLATEGRDGYRALAKFTQADILLQKNDLKGAAAKFAEVAGDTSLGKPFRDLALVRQTSAEFDTLKPQVVIERLRPLAAPGSAFLGSAGEMVAISHLRTGRRDLAGQLFAQIARDEGVPESLRQRAVQMAGAMGVDAVPAPAGAAANQEAR